MRVDLLFIEYVYTAQYTSYDIKKLNFSSPILQLIEVTLMKKRDSSFLNNQFSAWFLLATCDENTIN